MSSGILCGATGLDMDQCACPGCHSRRVLAKYTKPLGWQQGPKSVQDEFDIQVGRHALRSFRVRDGKLGSLYQTITWDDGTCIAECKAEIPCNNTPNTNCHCGVYGTLTLDHLMSQYRQWAVNGVAVIAAEGTTIIGSRGMRTTAARIVAYWTGNNLEYISAYEKCCPDAKVFTDAKEMLKEYKFPEYEREFPPHTWSDDYRSSGIGYAAGPAASSVGSLNQIMYGNPNRKSAIVPKTKADLEKLVDKTPGLTDAGKSAIKHIMGYF